MYHFSDSITVLGSRLGIGYDAAAHHMYLIRHNWHPGIPLMLKIGLDLGDKKIIMPFAPCEEGETTFEFIDQKTTPTGMFFTGIDPRTGLKIKVIFRIPFRPRDEEFSTTPVFTVEIKLSRLACHYRWIAQPKTPVKGQIFCEFKGERFNFKGHSVTYTSDYKSPGEREGQDTLIQLPCEDTIWVDKVHNKYYQDGRMYIPFELERGAKIEDIDLGWCVFDKPIFKVFGKVCDFKYYEYFKDLKEVVQWVENNYIHIKENTKKVDSILCNHTLGESVTKLMALALHSWLMNTWWVKKDGVQNWLAIWEGTCYYNSTVDVEYTQTPFYLAVWPELLKYQLEEWPLFQKQNEEGTYLCHDIGVNAGCSHQYYAHDMEVEENANYLLMSIAYAKRTGDLTLIKKYKDLFKQLMDFIVNCDTTGNGLVNKGCANTIDDASAAVQYAKEQVYLSIKALNAVKSGMILLEKIGEVGLEKYKDFVQTGIQTLEDKAWQKDHYIVALHGEDEDVINPWLNEKVEAIQGVDAYQIYTGNGLALTDMVGMDLGLNKERLTEDIYNATQASMGRYGSRHSSYIAEDGFDVLQEGAVAVAPKVGWVSMNMLRDIVAAYRGVDLFYLADKYWDWQQTANSQKYTMFFETFYGNNLHYYPRGVAIFGYFDAAVRYTLDKLDNVETINPIRAWLKVPILSTADWQEGTVEYVESTLKDEKMVWERKRI